MPKFNEVLFQIYQATLSLDHWPAALDHVAQLSGSAGALLYARGPAGWIVPMHSAALEPAVRRYRAEGWDARNPWLEGGVEAGYRLGDVYGDLDVLGPEALARDPFYTQFLAAEGLGWQMAAVLQSDLGDPTGLVAQRAPGRGAYGAEEKESLRLVARHVEQALRISAQLMRQGGAEGAVAQAFDAMEPAAFILDGGRRPVVVNRSGRDLVDRYFHEDAAALKPVRERDHAAFAALVDRAHGTEEAGAPVPATVADREGRSRMAVWALPLVGASADRLGIAENDRHTLVLAQPIDPDRAIDPAVLCGVFGLTLGEARLAALVGTGTSLRQAADRLGVTEGTARVVLKRVFAKLDVSRQAEMVAKLAVFAAPVVAAAPEDPTDDGTAGPTDGAEA